MSEETPDQPPPKLKLSRQPKEPTKEEAPAAGAKSAAPAAGA